MLQQIGMILTAALITAGASALQAQMSRPIDVTVPFDFTVGQKTFKAGEYRLNQDTPAVLKLRNTSTNDTAFVLTNSVSEHARKDKHTPALVFNRYGDIHFLSQIWPGYHGTGLQLKKSPAEREQMARMAAPTTVELATRARTR